MNDRQADLKRLAEILDYERTAAIPVIRKLLTMPSIPSRPLSQGWITVGMVCELADAVRDAVSETPERRGHLAHLATVIASALDDTYPEVTRAQCIADAWKEVANVRRCQNKYDAALEALDIADAALDEVLVNTYDQAVLALVRATVYSDMNRSDEARQLVDMATDVFAMHFDLHRVGHCQLLLGMVAQREGQPNDAITAYARALTAARDAGDTRTAGAALMNTGVLEAERGATGAAIDALQQARAIFRELRARVEIAHVDRAIGLALLTGGRYESAVRMFRDARGTFLELGLAEEGGLVGVELAEGYLARGHFDAARRLIHKVVEEFRKAKLNQRALDALAYLRDLGPAASPRVARHVHSYLVRLRNEPALRFLAPDESRG